MDKCFVMQPFDGGDFDSRYEDVIAPAIREAGLEPYRVDRDPKVSIPIQRQSKFPFDVQHRSIIKYSTGTPRDFEVLKSNITRRLKALMQKSETLFRAAGVSATRKIEGLEQQEVVTLAAIGENIDTTEDSAT